MEERYILISDASPLLTLSKAERLDVLLDQPLPIKIPDAVYNEAANENYSDGRRLMEWVRSHGDRVQIVPTEAGLEQQALFKAGFPARDIGEKAAVELTNLHIAQSPNNRVVLLYEDPALDRLFKGNPQVELTNTGAFLNTMEHGARIDSARQILDDATRAGQNMQRQIPELTKPPQPFLTEQIKNMEPLQNAFPDQVQNFEYRHTHKDGVTAYEHKETHGKLRIDPEGHTRDRYGAVVSPEKALESALSPQAEKSNGIGKAKDSGPGFEM